MEQTNFGDIGTEFLTSDLIQSRNISEPGIWQKLPDSIKHIINAIWAVESYVLTVVNGNNPSPNDKIRFLDAQIGNASSIRYLLDTCTQLSDEEKIVIAGNINSQSFYGYEGWHRYHAGLHVKDKNKIIGVSEALFLGGFGTHELKQQVLKRFSYVGFQ